VSQISSSIECRAATVLNEPEWKTIPWTNSPKNAKDLLGDIFAEIPGMLGELDMMRAATDLHRKETRKAKLVAQCRRLEKDWLRWGQESAPQKSPIAPDTMQPTPIIDHLSSAQIMSSYYAVGIFLYSISHLATGQSVPDRIILRLCRKIVEIIPTFLNPYAGSFGIHGAIFPSIVVIAYSNEVRGGNPTVETEALYKLFAQSKKGIAIRYFVDSLLGRFRARGVYMFT
jgi:hypothetical protein